MKGEALNLTHAISLGNVGLNLPLHSQQTEGAGGCNEGNPDTAVRRPGADRSEGGPEAEHSEGFQQIASSYLIDEICQRLSQISQRRNIQFFSHFTSQ